MTVLAPYDIANLQIDGFDVVLNKPKTAAYRAPSATNAAFATETMIDEIVEKLGMDPLEFRRINGAKEGTCSTCRTAISAYWLPRNGGSDEE